jgi:hypothetical protein
MSHNTYVLLNETEKNTDKATLSKEPMSIQVVPVVNNHSEETLGTRYTQIATAVGLYWYNSVSFDTISLNFIV